MIRSSKTFCRPGSVHPCDRRWFGAATSHKSAANSNRRTLLEIGAVSLYRISLNFVERSACACLVSLYCDTRGGRPCRSLHHLILPYELPCTPIRFLPQKRRYHVHPAELSRASLTCASTVSHSSSITHRAPTPTSICWHTPFEMPTWHRFKTL